MKGNRFDENKIKTLVRQGSEFVPVPGKTDERILALIREKTAAKPRLSIVNLIRYSPAFGAAAAAIVILPLVLVLAGVFLLPAAERMPLVAVTDKGGQAIGREKALRFGDSLGEKDVIRTGTGEQVGLERKGLIALQLFSNSVLEITGFSDTRRSLSLRLNQGALYIHKMNKQDDENPVTVAIDAYTFTLKGTRVYFSVDGKRVIRVICYDGLVEGVSATPRAGEKPLQLSAGEKAELQPDGTWLVTRMIDADEQALDEDLRRGLPRLEFIKEFTVAGPPSVLTAVETDAGETIPPFTVTAIGSIAAKNAGEGVRFYGAQEAGGRLFLINQEGIFTVEPNGIASHPGLIPNASFMVKPFPAGKYIGFAKPGAVVLLDPATLAVAMTVPLPKDGSIDHNFLPCSAGGKLILPVQNNGYYVLDPDAGPSSLRLWVKEPFPVGPLASSSAGSLYIGSYYNNFIGLVNDGGEFVFKTQLKGSAALNIAAADRSLFLSTAEPAGSFLVRLSEAGRETGRWPLAGALKADLLAAGGKVIGVFADGGLFAFDPTTGKSTVIDKLFRRTLTSRQWRNVGLAASGNLLYAPTDRGSLLEIDLLRAKIENEIFTKPGDEFYTAPMWFRDALYAVANSGVVYRIVKNGR